MFDFSLYNDLQFDVLCPGRQSSGLFDKITQITKMAENYDPD